MYAQLGNIIFTNLKGFNEFNETTAVSYAEHKPLAGKPRLQATGSNLNEISVSMRLHASFCDPAAELEQLKRYMDDNEIVLLVSGEGKKEGNFVITSINHTVEEASPVGKIFSYIVNCTLKEFVAIDRLAVQQDRNREEAAAVGDKKPVAKKKTNPGTCPQIISKIVTKIENHAKVINTIVLEKGGVANSVENRSQISSNLDAISKLCTDLANRVDNADSCAHNYPDIKIKATSIKNQNASFAFNNLNDSSFFSIPTENNLLQNGVKGLKTAASPLIKQSITGK